MIRMLFFPALFSRSTSTSSLGTLTRSLTENAVRPPAIIVVGGVVAVAHPAHFS